MLQLSGTMKSITKLFEDAGQTAAEGIENMRTVVSLNLENKFIKSYITSLSAPTKLVMYTAALGATISWFLDFMLIF